MLLLSLLVTRTSLLCHSESRDSARSDAQTGVIPSPVLEKSRDRTWGKRVRHQVAPNPDRKYLLWVSGKSSVFLCCVFFHDWACYSVLGFIGMNPLLKKRKLLLFLVLGVIRVCVFYVCSSVYTRLFSLRPRDSFSFGWVPARHRGGESWSDKCLRDPWREGSGVTGSFGLAWISRVHWALATTHGSPDNSGE